MQLSLAQAISLIWLIARKELRSLFLSPLAWVLLALIQLVVSYQFLSLIENYLNIYASLSQQDAASRLGVSDLIVSPLMASTAMVVFLVVPLLTMRSISEERRNGSLQLLLTAPIALRFIVLGKFFGLVLLMLGILAMLSLMPLSLWFFTPIDLGHLISSLFGLSLALAALVAAGLFFSSINNSPILAAINSFILLMFLVLFNVNTSHFEGELNILTELSLIKHLEGFFYGSFSSHDVVYFVLFMIFFLGLAVKRLDRERGA